MAPTTMPNQRTTTCPAGRDVTQVGYPIRMAEQIADLRTPGYVERVSAHTPKDLVKTKAAIRRAFEYQIAGECFSFVEVLSTCPTNWGLSARESANWLEREMMPYYPLGVYKTPEDAPGLAAEGM